MHKHATAFDLVLWATMVGAFDLAEVLLKHKSCESPLRAALIGQARHRTVAVRPARSRLALPPFTITCIAWPPPAQPWPFPGDVPQD